jgi:YtxH-like protein
MNALKDLNLEDMFDELRTQAGKRIDELRSEGRKQARKAGGGPDSSALFSAFTLGILAGAIAGAAIALLMTPFDGRQARAKLSQRVDKMRSDAPTSWGDTSSGNGKPVGSYEPAYSAPQTL